MEKKINKHKEE